MNNENKYIIWNQSDIFHTVLNYFFIFVIINFSKMSFNEMLKAQRQKQICSYIIAGGDRWINSLSVWCIRWDSSVTLQYFSALFLKGPADITGGSRGRPGARSSHAGEGERRRHTMQCSFSRDNRLFFHIFRITCERHLIAMPEWLLKCSKWLLIMLCVCCSGVSYRRKPKLLTSIPPSI